MTASHVSLHGHGRHIFSAFTCIYSEFFFGTEDKPTPSRGYITFSRSV